MKRKFFFAVVLPLFLVSKLEAQNSDNLPRPIIVDYINAYKEMAIAEMKRTGVPASITLAQGIHETEAGTSELVKKSNNHFGIKCKDTWTGDKVYHDDDAKGECFRSYADPFQSYRDHSDFLRNGLRYASLFRLDPADYEGWAKGLRAAGYATNKKYATILIRIINDYHLQDYTLIALGKLKPEDEWLASVAPMHKPMPLPEDEKINNSLPEPKVIEPAIIYPTGEFKINETRVTYATAGTSLLALAEQYGVNYGRLLEFNEIAASDENILRKGQLIYLQRKRKTGLNEFHEVKNYETLYDIAQVEGIRLESLLEYNFLNASMQPAPGVRLNLRVKASVRPMLTSEITPGGGSSNSITTHKVQMKETLYAISKKYNVPLDKLMEWNNLAGFDLKTGQELIIYKN